MPQSILNRGADTILNIGAWNDSPPVPDLNQALVDNIGAIAEAVVTILTVGDRNSLLNRGASGRLYIGAFVHPDAIADLNLALVDNLVVTESLSFTNTPTSYPFNSLMRRGASEDTIHHLGLDIGAWQTPFPRVAGIMPEMPGPHPIAKPEDLPSVSTIAKQQIALALFGQFARQDLDFGRLILYEMLIDDLTEIISYKFQVISGLATDTFSDDYIPFNFYTNHILLTVWDNPVDLMLTRHGHEDFLMTINGIGFLKKLSVRGWKIKNTTPGFVARYQLIALG